MSLYITSAIHSGGIRQTASLCVPLHVFTQRVSLCLLFWATAKDFGGRPNSDSNPQLSITNVNNIYRQCKQFYLHLVGADVELAEDVAEEVLDLVPGVDTVGTIQHNHDVHVC